MGSIIGQFKMTLLPKGTENRKNEENRLKIDKILLFLPFAQKIMFTFVIFSPHNQDSFHASSAQIHFSTPTAYSSVRRRTLIDLLGQYISAFASQPSDNVQIILSLVYDSIYNNFLSGFINFIKYKVFFKNQYFIALTL